ncbi:MAG TPA: peptide chain release factor 2 [Acidobacteriota bacterium]|nr:peptide chain release factor 2 [Acidobacteriota bacterium]
MIDELRQKFDALKEKVHAIRVYLDVPTREGELQELERRITQPDFWKSQEEAQPILQRRSQIENELKSAAELEKHIEDAGILFQLCEEGEPVLDDLKNELHLLEEKSGALEIKTLLSGEHDQANAIVTIHPGAGGTESQDWAEMLLRMYLRWAENHGYKVQMVDHQVGEEAGIKSATFTVSGDYAYGYLRSEIGVHRLVRISPYDANSRRHTSFASVFVSPEIDEDIEVKIEEKDLRIDTYRSSGAGGQHVNVTDSAIRITHLPTGIVVSCQNERSQHRNRDMAMKILKSKLYELELEKKRQELARIEDSKSDIGWGSQIRSYVLHPYRLAKDHRTKKEVGDVDSVLDGKIDAFIIEFLQLQKGLNAGVVEPRSGGSNRKG